MIRNTQAVYIREGCKCFMPTLHHGLKLFGGCEKPAVTARHSGDSSEGAWRQASHK